VQGFSWVFWIFSEILHFPVGNYKEHLGEKKPASNPLGMENPDVTFSNV